MLTAPALAQQSKAPEAARDARAASILEAGTLAPMLENVLPAVVAIRVKGLQAIEQNPLFNHPMFAASELSKETEKKEFQSSGSGVVIDAERGHILTNFHVIDKAKEIRVSFVDGHTYDGRLIGADAATDVAVVQVDGRPLTAVTIGSSHRVRVGDLVVAIGNPFGLEATATLGMVSSLARTSVGYRAFEAYIQHDAAVNSGNSGGPLVNYKGELVGINTAIISPSGGSVGLGFAIPIKMAIIVKDQLVKYGRVRRGWTGCKVADLTQEKATKLGVSVLKGAVVTSIVPGSPAEAAGVKVDDVVTAVSKPDGQTLPIHSAAELLTGEAVAEVGTTGFLTVHRGAQELKLKVTIAEFKRQQEIATVPDSVIRLAGTVVGSLEADHPLFGQVRGVEIVEIKQGSLGQLVGLLPGDVVTQVEQSPVRSPAEFMAQVKDRNTKFDMRVVRKNTPVLVRFPL